MRQTLYCSKSAQNMYKNASRIFNCLKVDLNENQLLKSLKQQRLREKSELERRGRVGENGLNDSNESSMSNDDHEITEVPRINYESVEEKRTTLQLAFSTLKCSLSCVIALSPVNKKKH